MKKTTLLWVAVLSLSLTNAQKKRPNLIFILADDMAWADVAFNGHPFFETPNIDKLAKDGVLLDQMYSGAPNCSPTRACLVSGMYPPRTLNYSAGAKNKSPENKMYLDNSKVPFVKATIGYKNVYTIADMLNDAGYKTARIGKWHLGNKTFGFDYWNNDGKGNKNFEANFYGKVPVTGQITQDAIQFMKDNKDNPFFLYVPLWDVHAKLATSSKLKAKYAKKNQEQGTKYNVNYAGMMEHVDNCVRDIRQAMEDLGIAEDTILLFSSDNGGATYTSNRPLKGSKGGVYEGGIRVPSCVYWKGHQKVGTVEKTVITSVDLYPTMAELAGTKLPTNQPVDGKSVIEAFKGTSPKALAERPVFWHFIHYLEGKGAHDVEIPVYGTDKPYFRGTPSSAVRMGDYKLIEFFETGNTELYNLKNDPFEKTNIAKTETKKHDELLAVLHKWQADTNAPIAKDFAINPAFNANIKGGGSGGKKKKKGKGKGKKKKKK